MRISVEQVKSYIRSNLSRISTVEDVAHGMRFSASTLKKTFHLKERIPISEYIRSEKLARAKELLRSTDLTCAEICYAVGWRPDSGARLFRRNEQMTMAEYRRHGM